MSGAATFRPGQRVRVSDAERRKGGPKVPLPAGAELTVISVTADGAAIVVSGFGGFWRADRFTPLD